MTLPAQIEQEIEKAGYRVVDDYAAIPVKDIRKVELIKVIPRSLVTKLASLLAPRPVEQAALEQILARCETEVEGEAYVIIAKKGLLYDRLVKRLMTWATTPPPEPKEWCSHCVSDKRGRWIHYDGWFIPDDWDRCPVRGCGQPRPGGAG